MSFLIKRHSAGSARALRLPEGAFKALAAPYPKPDLAVVNAGQGDARSHIRPNVKQPEAPSVAQWEDGRFVTLAEWLAGTNEGSDIGLVLMPTDDPTLLMGKTIGLKLIAIEFAKFNDGRGYSIANLLRTRVGFEGEVRAVGDVLIDQLFAMARCGFDSFALREGQDIDRALRAFEDFPAVYQNNADQRSFALQANPELAREAA